MSNEEATFIDSIRDLQIRLSALEGAVIELNEKINRPSTDRHEMDEIYREVMQRMKKDLNKAPGARR